MLIGEQEGPTGVDADHRDRVGRSTRHDRLRDRVRHQRARPASCARNIHLRCCCCAHRRSPTPTRIAAAIAGVSRPGDVVVLSGEMGAGKTAFAQGFGHALGVNEPITSPTFTLVHSYDMPKSGPLGRVTLAPCRPLPARPHRGDRRSRPGRIGRVRRHRARRMGRRRRDDLRRAPRRPPRVRRRHGRRARRRPGDAGAADDRAGRRGGRSRSPPPDPPGRPLVEGAPRPGVPC